ncbi:Trm112 family protein [Acetobacter persici]|uniref:UPF0434 protein A0U91_08475 n=1 Tax=Acetobacter persici TaxID=1076596 RepID=A0A1U9LEQ8_9PROT|nr:Trm112 family protein [Acetobacter persici]AQT04946.1 hypothetical protein A0U91_08475 [Acetobacter persici]
MSGAEISPPLDQRLLSILVCPVTKGPLTYDATTNELISAQAKLAFPIRDGIPVMLPEEARPSKAEFFNILKAG